MYIMFYLHPATWMWIIAQGIKRQPRQYRGSRAGVCIHSRITSLEEKSNSNVKQGVVLTNLLNIQPTVERHTHLSLAHVNGWSIGNKIVPIQHYLQDKEIDLCAITETWLKPDNMVLPREITPPGYDILSQPRSDGRQGGGVVLVYNSSLKVHNITQGDQHGGWSTWTSMQNSEIELLTFTLSTDILIHVSCNSLSLWQIFWKKIFYLTMVSLY